MTIAKLAAAGGVGVETVRYYQRRGLVGTPERSGGTVGIRHYEEADVRRLRFIRAAQAAGFTLEQIGELITLEATEERARVRELAATRVAALEARIEDLSRARDALRRLVRTCAATTDAPCPILTAFERG
jgi:MerR family mercuric resistance operon transcriptional regulator